MINNLAIARWVILYSWFVTALILFGIFMTKLFWTWQLRADFSEIYPAMKSIFAFVLPPLSLALSFFFSGKDVTYTLASLDSRQKNLAILCTILYQVLFVAAVIVGIWFYAFERPKNILDGLSANASAVGTIVGFLSFLLIPVNAVFLKDPKKPAAKSPAKAKTGTATSPAKPT